ncbi:HD domain-containing protein [Desulfobacterales bacterium HSG2]|nr:HD domain-containing protein [Desulfobacterales bacterium HSG2]
MQIPSKKECYQLIHEMEMKDHIAAHSIQVYRVATLLADHLMNQHINLNQDLIQASALLHDITKTRSFQTGENHALTGEHLLTRLGYAQVGNIVRQHVQLDKYTSSGSPTEPEIVNYADKRVLHDKVVPLRDRLNYILEKYGKKLKKEERIRQIWKNTEELENKIFRKLLFLPEEISALLPEDFSEEISAYHKACSQANP